MLARIMTAVTLLVFVRGLNAAPVILNEYNAVSDSQFLANGNSDPFWGTVLGNGGDWFELVVITDHLDMRGWSFEMVDVGALPLTLTLTNDNAWSNLRSGTIITISEQLDTNIADYNPALGSWWINVKANDSTDGTYITASNFFVNNDNWRLTIRNALNQVVFGPAGEGIQPVSGVGNNEVCKLEQDPSAAVTPLSAYNDGATSTFGLPNIWNSGASMQDFGVLRSVVPYFPMTAVRVNEVLTHTDPPLADFIELHNTTNDPVDISGWYLTDEFGDLTRFAIPPGTIIPALGYVVFDESQMNFGLSALGELVVLSAADSQGALTGGRDYIVFGAAHNGVSFGRYPNGTGPIYSMVSRTPAAANSLPIVGPIVINELMYHPPDLLGGIDNTDHEYIELHNITDGPAGLSTFFSGTGTNEPWRISGGVQYVFSVGRTIQPHGFLLVVGFDPVLEPLKLSDFRTTYGLPESVEVVGPYSGQLSNAGESIELLKPDEPQGSPATFTPYVLAEAVPYLDHDPWPSLPDGNGPSLSRIDPTTVGDVPENWQASSASGPTPGCPNDQGAFIAADINGDGLRTDADVARFVNILLGSEPTHCEFARVDLATDGLLNGQDVEPFVSAYLIP